MRLIMRGIKQLNLLFILFCPVLVVGATEYSFKDTVPDVIIASQSPADLNFGHFVATGGDTNGDGYDDILATSARWGSGRGQAYLCSM